VEVDKTWDELLETELIPFIDNLDSADMVMVAHITLPEVSRGGLPATLSYELMTKKLREELGYKGIIVTDALGMKAITDKYGSDTAAVLAFTAGADILLLPNNYVRACEGVLAAVNDGRIRVYFIEEGTELEIHDYRLSDNRFTGYIAEHGNDVEFSLYHVSSPNWSSYRWGYDAWHDDYYWSRETRGLAADKPVRRIGK
jgi:hypothetical protein